MKAITRSTAALLVCAVAALVAAPAEGAPIRPLSLLPRPTDLPEFGHPTIVARRVSGLRATGEGGSLTIGQLKRHSFQVSATELLNEAGERVSVIATASAFATPAGARWLLHRELPLAGGGHRLSPPPPIPGVVGFQASGERAQMGEPSSYGAGALFTSGRCFFTVLVGGFEVAHPGAVASHDSPAALTARRDMRAGALAVYRRTKHECHTRVR
jgi:hypothetical protein